jgi:hypothetical protein
MIVYFLTCNRIGPYVKELIEYLYRPDDLFIIHCDTKSSYDLIDVVNSLATNYPNVKLLSSTPYSWAGFSQVRTTLRAISYALEADSGWSHFVTLSEQHLPTMPPASLDSFLVGRGSLVAGRRVKEMGQSEQVDVAGRLAICYQELPGVGSFSKGIAIPDAELMENLYHGSNWYILSRKHCAYLCNGDVVSQVEQFANSIHADENAIQSVLWSQSAREVDSTENVETTFVAWPSLTDNHDMIFIEANFWAAYDSGMPFIRKRPSILPKSVEEHLRKAHYVNLEASGTQVLLESVALAPCDKDLLKGAITKQVALSTENGTVDFNESIEGAPYLYARINSPQFPHLVVAIISENLHDFKFLISQQHEFNGYWLPYVNGGREVSLIRARVHGLFFQKDISVPEAENYGFIRLDEPNDGAVLLRALDTYLRAAIEIDSASPL